MAKKRMSFLKRFRVIEPKHRMSLVVLAFIMAGAMGLGYLGGAQSLAASCDRATLARYRINNAECVRMVQGLLGVRSDGKYGKDTAAAVIAFQKRRGLAADGKVGPATRAAMGRCYGAKRWVPGYYTGTGRTKIYHPPAMQSDYHAVKDCLAR